MESLKHQIENYIPYNEQEENDKKIMLDYMEKFDNLLTRENEIAHFTASSWVVNKERTKVLMIFHNIYIIHGHGQEDMQMGILIYYLQL